MSLVPPVSLLVCQCLCLFTANISHFSQSIHAWPTSQRNKWVTLSFRATPLSSLSALLNSLKQLDFVIKPRSHSQSHTLLTHNVLFLATNIIQSLSCIYQQKGTIWWLPANQSFMSRLPCTFSLPVQSDHWKLAPPISSASPHQPQWYTCDIINLCIKRCVCVCASKCVVCKESQNRCRWAAVCSFPAWLTVGVTLSSEKSLCLVLNQPLILEC